MKLIQKLLYREKGIRYPDNLATTQGILFDAFPKSTVYHHFRGLSASDDVDPQVKYFQGYSKKILLDYVIEFPELPKLARKTTFQIREAIRDFKIKNRKSWDVVQSPWVTNQDPETLIVLNYGYLDQIYKFQQSPLANYSQWVATVGCLWKNVERIAKISGRNQYIFIRLPRLIVGFSALEQFVEGDKDYRFNQAFGLHDENAFFQLDLWKWLSVKNRDKSLLSAVSEEHFGKVNLVLESAAGKRTLVNLGYLNSWIKGQKNQTEFDSIVQHDAIYMQKLFLKLCMNLTAVADVDPEPIEDAVLPESVDPLDEDGSVEENVSANGTHSPSLLTSKTTQGKLKPVDSDTEDTLSIPSFSQELSNEIDKDIAALDQLTMKHLQAADMKLAEEQEVRIPKKTSEEVKALVFSQETPEGLLLKRLDKDAEFNLLTAADYRKLKGSSEEYLKSKDPYGSNAPRMEAMKIEPKDIYFTEVDKEIAVSVAVPDKSMAKSTMRTIDKKYIQDVLKKDVLRAVHAVQASGVIIKNHEIDVEHSVLGTYERHTLELKPIDGSPSTLSFTFPKIEEDGTFYVQGSKYMLRRQRVDLPIRKISPRVVSLSSYYGKTFVQSNPKVSNDSFSWLCRKINLSGLGEGGFITELNPGNVFDNEFKAPFIYSALSSEYDSFRAGKHQLDFDRKRIISLVGIENVNTIEKKMTGSRCCGYLPPSGILVVDKNDVFHLYQNNAFKQLGDIYELLQLEKEKAPVNFAEVRVYSKYIPVGVVLSYYIGFENLLTLLSVNYRLVEPRKQKALTPDEYAVVFKDKTYVFSRKDVVSSLVLSGFNEYEKIIKQFDSGEFNHKDIYLNLLMAKGMGAVYIRELDSLENAFVDPITLEILQDMKEPGTFKGLLVRSCEMLTTFTHPLSQDRSAMRDRGYERFAGALYKELTTSIRAFRNKNLVGRSKIDMSPFQVWNAIMKDASVKIVEDINPIQNLKESEVITYSGTGGRDKDSMTKETRAYHKEDFGILSESTVDSSAVGTIAYLTANPNIKSVRGLASDEKEFEPTNILSTPALLSPCSTNDD